MPWGKELESFVLERAFAREGAPFAHAPFFGRRLDQREARRHPRQLFPLPADPPHVLVDREEIDPEELCPSREAGDVPLSRCLRENLRVFGRLFQAVTRAVKGALILGVCVPALFFDPSAYVYSAPIACALSSMTGIPFALANSISGSISHDWPNK